MLLSQTGGLGSAPTEFLFVDRFDRADGALGPDWWNESPANLSIVSGKLDPSITSDKTAIAQQAAPTNAFFVEATFVNGAAPDCGVFLSALPTSRDNGYLVRFTATQRQVYRRSSGGFTELSSVATTQAVSVPYTVRVERSGSGIHIYRDGVFEATISDATHACQYAGVRMHASADTADDFILGAL